MIKTITHFILIIFVILLQINLLPFFYSLNNLNLALIIVILLSLIFNEQISFYWALGLGLILDVFSLAPFPLLTGILILTSLGIKFVSANLFNPKSFVSYLLIALLGILFFDLALLLTNYLTCHFFGQLDFDQFNWRNFIWQIILNLIVFSLLLGLIKVSIYKFKPRPQ